MCASENLVLLRFIYFILFQYELWYNNYVREKTGFMCMKKLILLRGLNGSGKSTKAQWLKRQYENCDNEHNWVESEVDSTNLFLCANCNKTSGVNEDKLKKSKCYLCAVIISENDFNFPNNKNWSEISVLNAMINRVNVIIVDNCNARANEMKFYVDCALQLGYEVEIMEPSTSWAFDPDELVKKSQHNVSIESIRQMLKCWEKNVTVDQIRASNYKDRQTEPLML